MLGVLDHRQVDLEHPAVRRPSPVGNGMSVVTAIRFQFATALPGGCARSGADVPPNARTSGRTKAMIRNTQECMFVRGC
jgi:hypothetical protein